MAEAQFPFQAGAVPVPNRLFDEVLPGLSDTELRVLLIVWRQTVGWREGSDWGGWRYKRRDWISHSQLMKKTGRGSEAVSKAITALVTSGLICVEDNSGKLLATPEERRRHLGRLYFRPGDMWKTAESPRPVKAKRTTDRKVNNIRRNSSSEHMLPTREGVRRRGWQKVAAAQAHG